MSGPSYLLALLPPDDVTERVVRWRERHGLHDAAAVPHITVKARSGLDADMDWQAAAQAALANHRPITFSFRAARIFPRGQALYLPVLGRGPVDLHLALLDAIRPAQRFGYEGPQMQPHLSVALARRGLDLAALLPDLQAEVADLAERPPHTAHQVALMRKPGPGGFYAVVDRWPLGEEKQREGTGLLGAQP
ncbi:2'-5' RNA ligase family protein [Deinococcus radiophilus]|uniref:2'-5' RNA ligase family protein n=1 Tax=Deinococcus radiophilus TaxID=32062 RepID=A0A431W5N3_9DEIO|nr:2'-5' RNA ligase family protein [Deinococcus radiophilus]RTR30693.1 2'-5' RNA ligase family protein [Deinococcus radiophilus]UFA51245.1 2'-5' RNA ligase family protein [Deinococcus radiophilus]